MYSAIAPLTVGQFALTQYQDDALGSRTLFTDANLHIRAFGYDALNRTVAITDALAHPTLYAYDDGANLLTLTDPSGAYSAFAYDPLNRLTKQEDHAAGPAGAAPVEMLREQLRTPAIGA